MDFVVIIEQLASAPWPAVVAGLAWYAWRKDKTTYELTLQFTKESAETRQTLAELTKTLDRLEAQSRHVS